jgi:hypothetical protein
VLPSAVAIAAKASMARSFPAFRLNPDQKAPRPSAERKKAQFPALLVAAGSP